MYGRPWTPRQHSPVRVLTHIQRLDDCFGQFLVRVICDCRAVREIEPEALAPLVGGRITLKELAPRDALLEVREGCRGYGGLGNQDGYRRLSLNP